MSEEEKNITVKQGNPFTSSFKGTLGKGCGCFVLILIVIIAIAVIGSAGSKNSSQSVPGGNQNSNKPTLNGGNEIRVTPTPEKIRARDLADDFDDNQVAAKDKWKDKFVEFSSQISNITDSGISFYNVASKQFSATQISCRIKDKQQLLPLKNGQTVTIRGVVSGQTIGVIGISGCEVVQ